MSNVSPSSSRSSSPTNVQQKKEHQDSSSVSIYFNTNNVNANMRDVDVPRDGNSNRTQVTKKRWLKPTAPYPCSAASHSVYGQSIEKSSNSIDNKPESDTRDTLIPFTSKKSDSTPDTSESTASSSKSSYSNTNTYTTPLHDNEIWNSVKEKLQVGETKSAVDLAVKFIETNATTSEERKEFQTSFRNLMVQSNIFDFEFMNGISDILAKSSPDETPPLFNSSDGSSDPQYASIYDVGLIDLGGNFHRTKIYDVLKPGFNHITDEVKIAIKTVAPFVGKVFNKDGHPVGTCLRISENSVTLPFHCIENLENGFIQFLDSDLQSYKNYTIIKITETYEMSDIAVVELDGNLESKLDIEFEDTVLEGEQLFLLHYPRNTSNDGFLYVSSNVAQLTTWDNNSLIVSHDSDHGSSGGIYINKRGKIVAIHIGADKVREAMNGAQKYARVFTGVVYDISLGSKIYNFLVLEGTKSKPKLITILKQAIVADTVPQQIEKDINAIIKEYERTGNYPGIMRHLKNVRDGIDDTVGNFIHKIIAKNEFRGIAGKHLKTLQWSISYAIDSEHPLPYDTFKKTTNRVLQDYIKGGGSRPGAGRMPAITIEYKIHRQLPTTGKQDKSFCDEILNLCNEHKIPYALEKILDSYDNEDHKYNLMTTTYKAGLLKLFNTPGKYYQKMVEEDIVASEMSERKAKRCRDVMAGCVTRIKDI